MRVKIRNKIRLTKELQGCSYKEKAVEIIKIIDINVYKNIKHVYFCFFDNKRLNIISYSEKFDDEVELRVKEIVPQLWMVRKVFKTTKHPDGVCYIKEKSYVEPVDSCPL